MLVDHGAVQPLELLAGAVNLTRIIPVFINCAAAPRASFARARALGAAVGNWAQSSGESILIMGSGGLSHDPPVPALATATPDVRARLIEGGALSHGQRLMRQTRAQQEGVNLAAGTSSLLPLNPEWDRMLLEAFGGGNLSVLDDTPEEELTSVGGRGGHEVRTWVAALSALGANYRSDLLFYEPINEWITGMGIMTAKAA
jgi:2,3-dihydroxyphenylpropionate 1,2-dioxygenase